MADTINMAGKNGGVCWDGVCISGAGRPRKTLPALDREIRRLVFKHRGSAKVIVDYVRKVIPAARKVCKRTVSKGLDEIGLAWLRRRRKTLVTTVYKKTRIQ